MISSCLVLVSIS
uniref:Uncharacterized protein n=1 Tax=Rhizophora mucronata TaxID=61149 RepID=A0A2P2Q3Z1_RHIMU